ncbi:MAG: plasmid partitioning protein RepB [Alphaproteobacteria bacterium]|nr:plasmid partitioning protein RepB [Alphaproteobacteria bacterium]MBU2191531.1 plasmid partitioning protein RepB [Alphaproteobacteria bacterium]
MSRKDAINSLFLTKSEPSVPAASRDKTVERVRTGAISAMGSSLQEMAETAKAATRLQEQLAAGEAVLALDPKTIDGSLIADRLHADIDPSYDQLVGSIAENGQQVPILVRPHPETAGRFQVAYGRRRLRAAAQLGKPVNAIVRTLTDSELVVAQGRENLDRADLSFIEKALFAKRLEDAGYDRATIMAALSTDKADLSRYITIARSIPENLAQKIGPAGKAGRARWLALAESLERPKAMQIAMELVQRPEFIASDSDRRFGLVLGVLVGQPRRSSTRSRSWSTPHGKKAARIDQRDGKTSLVFDEKLVPTFGLYVAERLDELYQSFLSDNEGGGKKQSD